MVSFEVLKCINGEVWGLISDQVKSKEGFSSKSKLGSSRLNWPFKKTPNLI